MTNKHKEENIMLETKCDCGRKTYITRLEHDELNAEGFYVSCQCGRYIDIDADKILKLSFITDVAKMADFKILSEKEFLKTYSYLTEKEYEATRLYFDWLKADESEP